jgi:parallel beta-helix repeat protein
VKKLLPISALIAFTLVPLFAHGTQPEQADKVTTITTDTVLDPNKSYGTLVIAASNITIDGNGVTLRGADAEPSKRRGTAIYAMGQSGVTVKNIRAHQFETGLHIVDGKDWTIENCDFSDNFHDEAFGWGENGRRGGIVLERVHASRLRSNRANRVWDACVLVDSNENHLEGNDFSHTSNTCLKLWHSSRNTITKNLLTHGIRLQPGEVHARDSTSVLIESGSNFNRMIDNDCRHGGDGIFIRVLNGWCSTDNYFEGNDCSHANNNGIECWAPRNEFVRNKANHCSYGFWLGGSDQTRLIDNEASFNGLASGPHNSPHLPGAGHAGIVFMFGPSSHVLARGNRCIGNNGAGIALIGDLESKGAKWKAFHWIIEQNQLSENRWGIYAKYADWLLINGNRFERNTRDDMHFVEGVSRSHVNIGANVTEVKSAEIPRVTLTGPSSLRVGEPVRFECVAADGKATRHTWDLGDGNSGTEPSIEHRYERAGFYRVGVNATFAAATELAYRDLVVVADHPELASDADAWSFEPEGNLRCSFALDAEYFVAGDSSVKVSIDPYHGAQARLLFPQSRRAGWSVESKSTLGFWLKAINPNMPGWQSHNPEITLYQSDGKKLTLTPKRDLFSDAAYSEAREGWRYIEIPLTPNSDWQRVGDEIETIDYLTIGVDSWDSQALHLWIDGLVLQ